MIERRALKGFISSRRWQLVLAGRVQLLGIGGIYAASLSDFPGATEYKTGAPGGACSEAAQRACVKNTSATIEARTQIFSYKRSRRPTRKSSVRSAMFIETAAKPSVAQAP